MTQWDFQNKGKSDWTGKSSFVLEVPLRHLRPSVIYSVPCDRILQRAYLDILRRRRQPRSHFKTGFAYGNPVNIHFALSKRGLDVIFASLMSSHILSRAISSSGLPKNGG